MNGIPGILRVGASAGVLTQAVRRQAVLGQAVRRHQAEVAAPK